MQKPKDMEQRTLIKRHAFGIKSDCYGCMHWLDEHTLTYPIGRNVVIHNVSSNSQKFFFTSDKTESITALALSPNKKYIAIAESGDTPQILIVDTNTRKRRRVLNVTDLNSKQFVAVEFSADGRHLVTQGGEPGWNLLYWNWERSKPLAQVTVSRDQAAGLGGREGGKDPDRVTKVSINPKDPLHIVVSGNGIFRFYRYVDGMLKPAPGGPQKSQTFNFTTHCWVTDDRIIAATDNADLFYIEDGEYRSPLASAPSDGNAIVAIEPTSKGFVCGGESGRVHVFEAADDKDVYRKVSTMTLDKIPDLPEDITKRAVIRQFALTHGEDMLAMATSTMQIYGLKFSHEWSRTETPVFHSIAQPFHADAIVGLDTCIRKPLVATSSRDKTVRVWNIQDNTVEIIKHFTSEPGAIALHPSGLHILICFADKVRFMNLHGDTFSEFKTFSIRGVNDVKFSVGGQYFAVVYSNTIQVYNTYTCEQIGSLRANSQKVRSIQWGSSSDCQLDTRIISCTSDGMVMNWNLRELRKEGDHVEKTYHYTAVAADSKNAWVIAEAPGRDPDPKKRSVKLRELSLADLSDKSSIIEYDFPDLVMENLVSAPNHMLLFGGCADGSIKLMNRPLQGGIHDPPILAHGARVNRIAVTYDENLFFSVGEDGSFYIFDVKEDGRSAKRETVYADEILISKGDLDEKHSQTVALQHNVQELIHDMEYNEKRCATQHKEKLKEQTNAFTEDANKQSQAFREMWNQKLNQEKKYDELKRERAAAHARQREQKETDYKEMVREKEEELKDKRKRHENQKINFEMERRTRREAAAAQLRDVKDKGDTDVKTKARNRMKLEETVQNEVNNYNEIRSQLEMDTDAEIENVKRKYEEALLKERENYLKMKGDNAILKKNQAQVTKETERRDAEIAALEQNKTKLTEDQQKLLERVAELTNDIDSRDQTIAEKEKKIYELKKKNQELEKHKFVLDHRIRQLKSQIEPRQMQIAREKEKIQAKDHELEQFHKNNLTLRANIEELHQRIKVQTDEIRGQLNQLKDFETYKSRVKTDIGELAQLVQDPASLRQGIEKVYHDHVVARGGRRTAPLAPELRAEFGTHTDYLGRTVQSLKRKVADDQVAHRGEVSGVMKDNLGLIKEINDLRREIARLKNQQSDGAAGTTAGSPSAPVTAGATSPVSTVHQDPNAAAQAAQKEIEQNRVEIQKLRSKIEELEKSITIRSQPRPASRDRNLPPLSSN